MLSDNEYYLKIKIEIAELATAEQQSKYNIKQFPALIIKGIIK